jgi:hypothetical protein
MCSDIQICRMHQVNKYLIYGMSFSLRVMLLNILEVPSTLDRNERSANKLP